MGDKSLFVSFRKREIVLLYVCFYIDFFPKIKLGLQSSNLGFNELITGHSKNVWEKYASREGCVTVAF